MARGKALDQPDAGLKGLDHYQQKLPRWRYKLRTALLPLVRWETPYLAWFQEQMRNPSLDSWFAITANLGTHTFYMIMLPVLFWCGYTEVGRGIVHLLASGVFISGWFKDMLCLPRPLSPPLHRITMSGSAALEYGFPSTHSTNAISVVVYGLYLLNSPDSTVDPVARIIFHVILYIFGTSIVIGRLYCGMHGFFDVITGSFLGALLGYVRCSYGESYDELIYSGSINVIFAVVAVVLALVRMHPEPADSCPCFDDSLAFAGVLMGAEFGNWHFAQTTFASNDPYPGTVPYDLAKLGWAKTILRIILGVVIVFLWREIMKPSLHKLLPPVFRVIERLGLNLPRRFFILASEYEKVPGHLKDDDVIPNVSEIPSILTSIRHPRRRAVSVGPQSEADAYETLAYREKRRRESISSNQSRSVSAGRRLPPTIEDKRNKHNTSPAAATAATPGRPGSRKTNTAATDGNSFSPPVIRTPRKLDEYEHMMGTGTPVFNTEATLNMHDTGAGADVNVNVATGAADTLEYQLEAEEEKEMFSKITPPRVRYDVEVVTKLVVYFGIGWLAVEFIPIMFQLLGLAL
ncbi:sphingosine-1-phosphate phosphohydrolase [Histoplasma capsulatum G186AR]|nr:sphingosine-1-phosphate phosphohydrolase [Histoplasma capsulatum G186AR]